MDGKDGKDADGDEAKGDGEDGRREGRETNEVFTVTASMGAKGA